MDFEKELQQIARQYQEEGYRVALHPNGDQLPPFAADFGIDILATRGDENVLVQVKEDRADLEADPDVPRWAGIVNAHPGWSYDLIVLRPESPVERAARLAGEPSTEQIEQMLDEAERLGQGGDFRAGLVLAWAGLEAVMRRSARRAGLERRLDAQPLLLVRELYAAGSISPEDFALLERARQLQTRIVHGLAPPTIDQEPAQGVIALARRMLAESEPLQAAAS